MKTTIFLLIIVSSQNGCVFDMLDTSTITTIQFVSQTECEEDANALNTNRGLRAACMIIEVTK